MKRALMILLLCCSIFNAEATVFVSGSISANTTWTKVNSPYIVNGDLSVDSGVLLTIEPGVSVRVDSGFFFHINGSLLAHGTATDSILFTSTSATPSRKAWNGITLNGKNAKDSGMIKYCRFEYAAKAILITYTNITATNSLFRYNTTAVYLTGTQRNYSQRTYMWENLITRNDTGLYNNRTTTGNGNVVNNNITYNNIGIREEFTDGIRSLSGNNINYNMIGYSANGGAHGPMQNTYIGNLMYGAHVVGTADKNIGYISVSTFVGNPTAIYIDSARYGNIYANTIAYSNIGIEDSKDYRGSGISNSYIYLAGNCYRNNTVFNYRINSAINRNTKQDYWGTTSTAGIDSTIYDFYDNTTLGKLNYTQIQTTSNCLSFTPPPPCYPQPSSLSANITSKSTASVSWPSVSGAYAYEYYIIPAGTPPPSSGIYTFDTSFIAKGLIAGKTYYMCVRTRCQVSPFASAWMCDSLIMPCAPPTTITVNNVNVFNATVSWDTVDGVTGYEYYILPHPSTPPSTATFTTNNTAYLTGLTMNTTFDFCIRSVCGTSTSEWICDTLRTTTGIGADPRVPQPHIYPNPSNGIFMADIPANMQAGEATVLDVNGRVIARQTYTPGTTLKFELGNIAKGIYVVQFTNASATFHTKLTLQ